LNFYFIFLSMGLCNTRGLLCISRLVILHFLNAPRQGNETYLSILQREVNEFYGKSSRVGPKPSSTKEKRGALCLHRTEERAPNRVYKETLREREGDRQDLEEFTHCSAWSFPGKSQFLDFLPFSFFCLPHDENHLSLNLFSRKWSSIADLLWM
jgi:hypothetical protein